jgi:hypothetical protein
MKGLIAGIFFSALSVLGMAQERYAIKYQRIMNRDESKILEFFVNNPATNNEQLICYGYRGGTVSDISEKAVNISGYNFVNSVGTDNYKLDSLYALSKNLVLAHQHNQNADAFREVYADKKRLYRKMKKIPDDVIEKRATKEIPSVSDIVEYCRIRDKYEINEHYIEVSGNLYSFSINQDVSVDSARSAYTKVFESIRKDYCAVYKKPGKCKEPDMNEISSRINEETPVKILDHNVVFPKTDVQFDKADSVIYDYLDAKLSEHVVIYDLNNNTLTDVTNKSYSDSSRINMQKLDSLFQHSSNVVLGHNHTAENRPMLFYPSPSDVSQLLLLKVLFSNVNISSRIYPNATEKIAVEYSVPKNFSENISGNGEKDRIFMRRVRLNYIMDFYLRQQTFENSKKSLIKYNQQNIPITVHGEKKN